MAVHYVGTLHDGTEFDSSRVDDRPFTVELGKNRVIKAWEVRGRPPTRSAPPV
jgi:FKBP-type peptidyl-prolyl cis-trans isomerase